MNNKSKHRPRAINGREKLKRKLQAAFRARFPQDTVDISDGFGDNIHVLVVSRSFDDLSEKQKQERLWAVIDDAGLTEVEKGLISLVYPVSVAELK